ncbi:MAG: hypothetical protein RLZZ399_2309 [Verrucomicrobiota bacterium]|jgi:membrane associated rhomboid family serine protease
MDANSSQPDEDLRAVGHFSKLAKARECALVLEAKGFVYQITRAGSGWIVEVEGAVQEDAAREWSTYLMDREPIEGALETLPPVQKGALFVVVWVFLTLGVLQVNGGRAWLEAGILDAGKVVREGQIWRVVTALTLHGDAGHLIVNLGMILVFGGLLSGRVGQGLGWLLVLGAGALGNLGNAWFYGAHGHRSLGASTAVFGALGLLCGNVLGEVLSHRSGRLWWRWILPVGAGLALLADWGSGGGDVERVDVLAHLWGGMLGLPLGWVVRRTRLDLRVGSSGGKACGWACLAVLGACWWWGLWAVAGCSAR